MLFLDKKVLKSVPSVCLSSSMLGSLLSDSNNKKQNKNSCVKETLSCRVLMDDTNTHTHILSYSYIHRSKQSVNLISISVETFVCGA